jgi:hypothetical protein
MIAWLREGVTARYIIRNYQGYQRYTHFRVSGLSVNAMLLSSLIALNKTRSVSEICLTFKRSLHSWDASIVRWKLKADTNCRCTSRSGGLSVGWEACDIKHRCKIEQEYQ